jgi:hypothetical protein
VVGIVVIGHTYRSATGTVFLGSDGFPLPSELLSAASPSLRFFAFLGCHGEGIPSHYQVAHELSRIPWNLSVFHSRDRRLSIRRRWLGVGFANVLNRISDIAKALNERSLTGGTPVDPLTPPNAELRIRVKDVFARLEVRYVRVNGWIVGTLGSDPRDSNSGKEWRELSYSVPAWALAGAKKVKIEIRSAELSGAGVADDFLLSSVRLETQGQVLEKAFPEPLHLGTEPGACERSVLYPLPTQPSFLSNGSEEKDTERKIAQYWNAVAAYARSKACLDPDPKAWPELSGRFASVSLE